MTIQLELILRLSAAMPCRSTFTLSTPFWLEGKWRRLSCAMNGENWGIFYTMRIYIHVYHCCAVQISICYCTFPCATKACMNPPLMNAGFLTTKNLSLSFQCIYFTMNVYVHLFTVTNIYHMKGVYCSHMSEHMHTQHTA